MVIAGRERAVVQRVMQDQATRRLGGREVARIRGIRRPLYAAIRM
jgi:hypothetical protein